MKLNKTTLFVLILNGLTVPYLLSLLSLPFYVYLVLCLLEGILAGILVSILMRSIAIKKKPTGRTCK